MRLGLVACDMLSLPLEHVAAGSPHELIVSKLSASLHAEPASLRERIQAEVDELDRDEPRLDAVLLGYGLCGGATAGVAARTAPLVLTRAHDCATILLGSRTRYQHEHETTPGTYWFTEDNVSRGTALTGWLLGDAGRSDEIAETHRRYVERYGRENADYLMEVMGEWRTRYERGVFLETGLSPDDTSLERARRDTESRGWRFERIMSDLTLIERLLGGEWDDDFLVVAPGERIAMSHDDDVLKAVPGP